jgi:hypothetical protein
MKTRRPLQQPVLGKKGTVSSVKEHEWIDKIRKMTPEVYRSNKEVKHNQYDPSKS